MNKIILKIFFVIMVSGVIIATIKTDPAYSSLKGDLDCDGIVELSDVIIALQIACDVRDAKFCFGDVNNDERIGLAEAVYAIRRIAGLIRIPPVIEELKIDPGRDIGSGERLALSASAYNPDGRPLMYQWVVSAGKLSDTIGENVTWTAPDGSGSARLTLTVSDDMGNQTIEKQIINWTEDPQSTTLRCTVKDNPESNLPVSGVYVILHHTDNKSVEQYIETGDDGVADFGEIGRDRATLTIVKGNDHLRTYVNVSVGNILCHTDIPISEGFIPFHCSGDSSDIRDISITLADVPEHCDVTEEYGENFRYEKEYCGVMVSSFPLVLEYDKLPELINPFSRFLKASAYPNHIQSDRRVSFLSAIYSSDIYLWDVYNDKTTMLKYGFLLDRPLAETYTVITDKSPDTIRFMIRPDLGAAVILVKGVRKGVSHILASKFHRTTGEDRFAFPGEFPAESYQVRMITSYTENPVLTTRKRYDRITPDQPLDIPAQESGMIKDVSYTEETSTFNWSFSGSTEPDVISVELFSKYGSARWIASMNGKQASWTLPELPELPGFMYNWSGSFSHYAIDATDMDVFGGFDNVWGFHKQGNDPESVSSVSFITSYVQSAE